MGYSTDFEGELKFTKELNAPAIARLSEILGEDAREHSEWEHTELSYIDLEFNGDSSGLQWNGAEKTYDLPEKVNLIIKLMREEFPDFGLSGHLDAFGEERGDVWKLIIGDDGFASRKE